MDDSITLDVSSFSSIHSSSYIFWSWPSTNGDSIGMKPPELSQVEVE